MDKYDNRLSLYYTGNIYRCFRNYKRGNTSDHDKGANQFNIILEHEGENCYIPSGKGCFLKCMNYIFEKTLAWIVSDSYNHIKEDLMLWLGVEFQIFVNDIK